MGLVGRVGLGPATGGLCWGCADASSVLTAQMTRAIALTALTTLGLLARRSMNPSPSLRTRRSYPLVSGIRRVGAETLASSLVRGGSRG